MRVLDSVSRIVARATVYVCVAMVFAMLALLAAQIVARYFLGAPPSWTEEVAIGLFTWVVLLAGSVGVRERFHVAVDLLSANSSPALRRSSDRLVLLLTFGFGGLLAWSGYHDVIEAGGMRSAALRYPIEALHLAAPVSGVLVSFHALARLFRPEGGAS